MESDILDKKACVLCITSQFIVSRVTERINSFNRRRSGKILLINILGLLDILKIQMISMH